MALIAAALMAGTGLAACGGGSTTTHSSGGGTTGTLTLWNYGSLTGNPEVTVQVKDFEKLHPGAKIKVVAEPSSNYFQLLQAALTSGKAPDLVDVFAGTYLTPLEPYLLNVAGSSPIEPVASLSKVPGISNYTSDGNVKDGTYAIPEQNQFYNGYYNKALFKKAGISSVPQDWSELYTACTKLKHIGVTPIAYGNGGAGGEFGPLQDWSYLLSDATSLSQWNQLLSGHLPYTDAAIVQQVTNWAKLYKMGCTSSNALTNSDNATEFEHSKAAMSTDDGSWDIAPYQASLGKNLGLLIPPYSTKPSSALVEMPGAGFAVSKSTSHRTLAVAFLKYIMSSGGQKALVATHELPDLPGYPTGNPLAQQLIDLGTKSSSTIYPMFDNYMQPAVLTVAQKELDQAFVGQISAKAALSDIAQAVSDLPSAQRKVPYHL